MAERKVWVLDTETKGTGAQMVPLERVLERPQPGADALPYVPRKREPEPEAPPAPPPPRRFRVVDVMTRRLLADDADVRATLDVLGDVRRANDVTVYVWQASMGTWRLLTLAEQRALWDRRTA